ncbi:DinB superfamily protein [Rubripirellula lacrimiformis]|uniref:DinB superfamily protein n=2 Tax=Rubripirellula lacrimiformis TaxID=1930273 RepID=A0A517NIP1_9BACT|nr:DinB superfamily protein [Rubripirellula lacrimiformis]
MHRVLILLIALLGSTGASAMAATGEPLALQKWPSGEISVESHSGQTVRINDQGKWVSGDQDWVHSVSIGTGDTAAQSAVATDIRGDGVTIRMVSASVTDQLGGQQLPADVQPADAKLDVLILASTNADALVSPSIQTLVTRWDPLLVVFSGLQPGSDSFASVSEQYLSESQSRSIPHNTLAICAADPEMPRTRQVIAMGDQAWQMPADLEKLFAAMESSCENSQQVFAKLSTAQMNFKPSNGTHTPRWNTEHMMGRQLQFFSQIYHAVDPVVPVMNLNPKQMPPDYQAAHPEWDGAAEAKQMQLVSDFCRRFAYLLDGIGPDQKAPGSRWPSLRALLVQMNHHYDEHTANTVKKFELPDWPAK